MGRIVLAAAMFVAMCAITRVGVCGTARQRRDDGRARNRITSSQRSR
jgi:hypothetical protein